MLEICSITARTQKTKKAALQNEVGIRDANILQALDRSGREGLVANKLNSFFLYLPSHVSGHMTTAKVTVH